MLNRFIPSKKKYARASQGLFMNQELHKSVMVRSQLRNKSLRSRSGRGREAYNKGRNIWVDFLKKAKRNYFSNLNTKCIADYKRSWKTVKSSLTDKSNNVQSIALVENDWIVSDNIKVANIFHYYLSNLVKNLNFQVPENLMNCFRQSEDPVFKAILKYQNDASITAVKEIHHMNHFSFNTTPLDDIKKELQYLDSSIVTQISDIPTKTIKDNIDIISPFLFVSVKDSICQSNFPYNLQFVDVMPVYKKEFRHDKTNYRLRNLSKVLENILDKQKSEFF